MKLEQDLLDFLKRALRTAHIMKFDDFVIEKEHIRGWNAAKTAIIADKNVPKLPFAGVGFNRVGTLLNRLSMMDDYTLDLEIKNDFVMGLVIKSDVATIKYKCANPNAIKTPKHIHDTPMWSMELSPKDMDLLFRAQSAMGAQSIQIRSVDGACSIKLIDAERDTFEQLVLGHVVNVGGINESLDFDKQYDTAMFLAVMKQADKAKISKGPEGSIAITIGQGGNLATTVNGISVNVVPKVPPKSIL